NNNNYILLFVGDTTPKYKDRIVRKSKELGISNNVIIRQSVKNDEIRKVFSLAEVAIWPHGSSMAMIEAMVCNCPVIASSSQVNNERLGNGRGILYLESENKDLVNAIVKTFENREQIIINARKWAIDYSWEKLEIETMDNVI
ncbi:MAG: glycosyltransferase family 4 protein, partial [Bacteroidetes bacterium]|nr:glycosyltransferase family 4 protein [Bacteroidota bacterium]